jgi:hypothetical protein
MRSKKKLKLFILATGFLFVLCFSMMVVDYWRTIHGFEKPFFAICRDGYDDGGSGIYTGMGYSFSIKGNFMPEDKFPGATHTEFYILGNKITESIRD